ncbi:MAG: flagellar motor stator protein MotA [Proteobacteria bacterium]|nr:flagellar motor stator protein MotA [Pseudomonadota bacterium]
MKLLGLLIVIGGVFAGYLLGGGHMAPILHAAPHEMMTIGGAAIGAFLVANTPHVIKDTVKNLNCLIKPEAHNKESYIELLSVLFSLFKLARTKGWLALESHIEQPDESELFKQFPGFHHNHHALLFLCDYLRIISLGKENPHEIEALMDEEIETIRHEKMHPSHAVQTMADGIPALGIVAAVLGVIKTMGSITEPPEVLGKMIGGALVGTFLGVFLAYGFVGPIAGALGAKGESEIMYYRCIKVAVVSFLNGSAPQVAVEFARKFLPHNVQPTFMELEEKLNELPAPG